MLYLILLLLVLSAIGLFMLAGTVKKRGYETVVVKPKGKRLFKRKKSTSTSTCKGIYKPLKHFGVKK